MPSITCKPCRGSGWRNIPCGAGPFGEQTYYYGECPTCYGSGKRDTDDDPVDPREYPEQPHNPRG